MGGCDNFLSVLGWVALRINHGNTQLTHNINLINIYFNCQQDIANNLRCIVIAIYLQAG
jgi:hypothetical protein